MLFQGSHLQERSLGQNVRQLTALSSSADTFFTAGPSQQREKCVDLQPGTAAAFVVGQQQFTDRCLEPQCPTADCKSCRARPWDVLVLPLSPI